MKAKQYCLLDISYCSGLKSVVWIMCTTNGTVWQQNGFDSEEDTGRERIRHIKKKENQFTSLLGCLAMRFHALKTQLRKNQGIKDATKPFLPYPEQD